MIHTLDRYGEPVEADFHAYYRLDLIELLAAGRWRKIGNLIRRLPAASEYRAAVADDEEAAEAWLEAHDNDNDNDNDSDDTAGGPSWAEMSYTNQLLTALGERMDQLIKATVGDESRVRPWPRPRSALDRVEKRRRMDRHTALVDEVNEAMRRWDEQHQ